MFIVTSLILKKYLGFYNKHNIYSQLNVQIVSHYMESVQYTDLPLNDNFYLILQMEKQRHQKVICLSHCLNVCYDGDENISIY